MLSRCLEIKIIKNSAGPADYQSVHSVTSSEWVEFNADPDTI